MSAYDLLEDTINQVLVAIKPSRHDWVVRFEIINDFKAVVESVGSLRGATVEPFGSFVSNLFSQAGDLDISIELANGSHISSAGRKHKLKVLRDVFRALRGRGVWRDVKFIANARVPIIKFETSLLNISCDISIDNLIGQMKSKFLLWISGIDERFRDMVLLVKEWAKAHDINNSKSGTLNSYSLSLLVVFHFQTCKPAILPPLKEIYQGNIADDLTGVRADAENSIAEICTVNIARFRSDRSRIPNRSSLSELFISFLAKFSNIDSMALEQGISLYNGRWEDIHSNMGWLPKTYAIWIDDPFEQPANAARAVSSRNLARISKVLRETHCQLVSPVNQSSLLATLVCPQIAQSILGTPHQNQTVFNGGYTHQNSYAFNGGYTHQNSYAFNGGYTHQNPSAFNGGYTHQNPSALNGGYTHENPSGFNGGHTHQNQAQYRGGYAHRNHNESAGGSFRNHSPVDRVTLSPWHVNSFPVSQNTRRQRRPHHAEAQKPVQTNPSNAQQQVWRPRPDA